MTKPPVRDGAKPYAKNAGNIFFALFAAVGMVGAVGYGFNTVIKGPISAMSDTTRRTVAESTVITSSRLAIVGATTQQINSGDCDNDGAVEPLPYRDPGGAPAPIGGGYLPADLLPNSIDPWNTEYGYCAWDTGSVSVSNAHADCGGASPRRLQGSPLSNQYAIAIISAGKDRTFQTRCNAYVDTTPADGRPDTPLIQKAAGSDDIVLGYTYAEANDLGNGLWKPKTSDPTTAITSKNLEVAGTGGGKFGGQVALQGNTTTGGGLILPGDPGDNSITGACSGINDKQLRYNIGDGSSVPVIEICDNGGLGWTPVSGGVTDDEGNVTTTGKLIAHWKLNEAGGNYAKDSVGNHDGVLSNAPTWDAGILGGALNFSNSPTGQSITVPQRRSLEPTAITISAWVRPAAGNQPTSNSAILGYQYNSMPNNAYTVQYQDNTAGPILFGVRFGPSSSNNVVSVSTNANKEWVHVVAIYDPNGPAPQQRIYINGALEASATVTSPIYYSKIPTDKLYIGNRSNSNGPLRGLIDDVRLYNYGLSDAEAKALYVTSTPNKLNLTTPMKPGMLYTWGEDFNGMLGNGPSEGDRDMPGPAVNGDFTAVANTGYYGCGIKPDTTVWCWGRDDNGVLGNGPGITADQQSPYQVPNFSGAVDIDTMGYLSCALKRDGTMWCWGQNTNGGVGNGTTSVVHAPVRASGFSDFIDMALANQSACGLRYNGEVWCWGAGAAGELGNGTTTATQLTPVKVSNISNFISLTGAATTICGVTTIGTGYCWGTEANGSFGNGAPSGIQSTPSQITGLTDLVKVDIAPNHGCGLRANGQISCWGRGTDGALGNGLGTSSTTPVTVSNITDFTDVVASGRYSCGVRSNKELWCWGSDAGGRLGNGPADTANKNVPTKVIGNNFMSIAGSSNALYALVDTSAITTTSFESRRPRIAGGDVHSCFLRSDNSIRCAGSDASGQLGNGAPTADQDIPAPISSSAVWTGVYADGSTSCGIQSNGSAWCWGSDSNGQLGNGGTTGNQISPSAVTPDVGPWSSLSVGMTSTCGITADGRGWCWGDDAQGQLGNGASGAQIGPDPTALVSGGGTWKTVSMGTTHACGVKSDGSAWCWGSDTNGRLGNGAALTANQTAPSQVAGSGKWSDISAGNAHSCGVKTDGSGWCWGLDTNGRLGNGSVITTDQVEPFPVAEPGPWKKIIARQSFTCGIKMDGSGWCWGNDANGKLGNGATITTDQHQPSAVVGPNIWVDIAAGLGGGAVFAEGTDGSIWAWGLDNNGRLGNGPDITADQTSPGPVIMGAANFASTDAAEGSFASQPSANMAIGSTKISNAEGGTPGMTFPGGGRTLLHQNTGGNQFLFESDYTAGAAQFGFTAAANSYFMGMDISQGNLKIGPTLGGWLGKLSGLDVANTGYVGVGTHGAPVAKLDVRGGVRVGNVASACNATRAGVVKYADNKISYCNGSDWIVIGVGNGGGTVDTHRTVFVTSTQHKGNLGGIAGGDAVCNARAAAAGLPGTFMAWLSDSTTSPLARFEKSSVPYKLANGTIIANDWADLVDGTLSDSIDINEFGASATGSNRIWTNTSSSGSAKGTGPMSHCLSWQGGGIDGNVGRNYSTSSEWTSQGSYDCEESLPIYCFQQGPAPAGGGGGFNCGAAGGALVGGACWIYGAYDQGCDTVCGGAGAVYDDATATYGVASNANCGAVLDALGVSGSSVNYDSGCSFGNVGCGWLNTGVGRRRCGNVNETGRDGSFRRACACKDGGLAPSGGKPTERIIFVTSATYTGATVGGVAGADTKCNALATAQGLGGTYKAWLAAGAGTDPNTTFEKSTVPYKMVNGTTIANNWTDLTDGTLSSVISIDETGTTRSSIKVWTNVTQAGAYKNTTNCTGWTSTGGSGVDGNNASTTAWSDNGTSSCSNSQRLYCVEQGGGSTATFAWDTKIQSVSTGNNHSCGITSSGKAYCWGDDAGGKLGNGGSNVSTSIPTAVDSTDTWIQISGGWDHTCGIKSNGTLWCWGAGASGRLGNGSTSNQSTPVEVSGGGTWKMTAAGREHTCGIKTDGSAWCWGSDSDGQIGEPTTGNKTVPTQVHQDVSGSYWYDWIWISTAYTHSCGVRANGTAWCWGDGENGRLGRGSTSGSTLPVMVHTTTTTPGWSDWTVVEAGTRHSCGIRTNGEAYCWGDSGRTGISPAAGSTRPVKVHDDSSSTGWNDWISLDVNWHSCGVRANGRAYCWGDDASGRLGNGTDSHTLRPGQVNDTTSAAGFSDWLYVTIGDVTTCGARVNGELYCWGAGGDGQLGNGETSNNSRPVQVNNP